MEEADRVREVPPQPASVESRSKRAGKRPSPSARSGSPPSKNRGRGSTAAAPPSATAKVSNASISVQQLDPVSEGAPSESNSFDMDDSLSVSLPTAEGASGSNEAEVVDGSQAQKAKRRNKSGANLSPSKCKVKKVQQRAPYLKYYKIIEVPSDKERGKMITKAKCRFCSKKYVYTPGGPTTTLNRHLQKQCTAYLTKLAKAKSQLVQGTLTFSAADGSIHVNPSEYDHDHTKLLIAKMIIAHQYPFRMVEHKWFNVLMSWMNPNYDRIGRKGIKNECMKVYESEKDLLKKSLREAESISLTTDLWTSNQNIQYMCLVAHYVDVDWVLQCRVLNFVELDPPHMGIVIAQAIFECLVEWKIEDKIMTITLDNASNNDTAVTNLKTKLLARKNTLFDPIYFHVRCSSHIVNLVVNDGLLPLDPLISNVRNSVKYFKRSPARIYKFVEVCNNYSVTVGKGLSLDVKTRWNSTYRMLDSCIHCRNALGYYKEVDHNYCWKPTDSEWDMFDKIKPILGTMAGATTAFSGSQYPTANVFYPYIVKVKIALRAAQQSADAYLSTMAAAMLLKFDKYWEERNNVMVIATILDPRFKMRYIKWCFGQIYDGSRCQTEFAEINRELENLYNQFEKLYRQKMGDNNPQCAHQSSSSKGTSSSLSSVVPDEFNAYLRSSATETSKSELLIYLDEPNVPVDAKHFDLLSFWKLHAHRFPVVSSMAKRFLAVSASSVSSESTFSTGGRILDDYRSSLKPDTVQALVCASSWIQAPQNDKISTTVELEDDDGDDVESVDFPKDLVASN